MDSEKMNKTVSSEDAIQNKREKNRSDSAVFFFFSYRQVIDRRLPERPLERLGAHSGPSQLVGGYLRREVVVVDCRDVGRGLSGRLCLSIALVERLAIGGRRRRRRGGGDKRRRRCRRRRRRRRREASAPVPDCHRRRCARPSAGRRSTCAGPTGRGGTSGRGAATELALVEGDNRRRHRKRRRKEKKSDFFHFLFLFFVFSFFRKTFLPPLPFIPATSRNPTPKQNDHDGKRADCIKFIYRTRVRERKRKKN